MGIGAHLVVAWQAHQLHGTLQHLFKYLLEVDGGVRGSVASPRTKEPNMLTRRQ